MDFIVKEIDNKHVLWLQNKNQYLITDSFFFKIIQLINVGKSKAELIDYCLTELFLSNEKSELIVAACLKLKVENKVGSTSIENETFQNIELSKQSDCISYTYQYNSKYINVQFSNEKLAKRIHPKFQYLCENSLEGARLGGHIFVQEIGGTYSLFSNDTCIGQWKESDFHFFLGKISMTLLNLFNDTKEEDWLAVLHASAVCKNNKALIFLGVSGSGKSTAITMLSLNEFELLADDFVPIHAKYQKAVSFPAAISVKESLHQEFEKQFPNLKNEPIRKKNSQIKFKYLYPTNEAQQKSKFVSTNALIFIKYHKNGEDKLTELSSLKTLEKLIPDSWISPLPKNVPTFLDWIVGVPCYELVYSENDFLLNVSNKLIANDF